MQRDHLMRDLFRERELVGLLDKAQLFLRIVDPALFKISEKHFRRRLQEHESDVQLIAATVERFRTIRRHCKDAVMMPQGSPDRRK